MSYGESPKTPGTIDPSYSGPTLTPEQQAAKETLKECRKLLTQIFYYDKKRIIRGELDLADFFFDMEENEDFEQANIRTRHRMETERAVNPLIPSLEAEGIGIYMGLEYKQGEKEYRLSMDAGTGNPQLSPLWTLLVESSDSDRKGYSEYQQKGPTRENIDNSFLPQLDIWVQTDADTPQAIPATIEEVGAIKKIFSYCLDQAIEHSIDDKEKE